MFVLLKLIDADKSMKNRIRDKFFAPKIEIERVELKKAAPFFVMTCPKYKGTVPYNAIVAASGKLSDRLVVPATLDITANAAVRPFRSDKLKKQLLMNTALKILSAEPDICRGRELIFEDEFAVYQSKIEKFALFADKMTVVTRYPEKYDCVSHALMKKHGLYLTVKEGTLINSQSGIVISNRAEYVTPYFKGLLFTNSLKAPSCAHCVTGNDVDLGIYTDYEFPSDFNSVDIGEAMYELCYAGKLADQCYKSVFFDSVACTYEETKKYCLNSRAHDCK